MDKDFNRKITFEISEIETLLGHASILLEKCKLQEPDFIELSAVGSTLHSFYNGLENIFLLIRKEIDKKNDTSGRWHSELLDSMFKETENRTAVLDESLRQQLSDYMASAIFSAMHTVTIYAGIWQNRFLTIFQLFGNPQKTAF